MRRLGVCRQIHVDSPVIINLSPSTRARLHRSLEHVADELGEEFALAGDPELGIDALAVVLHRALGDIEIAGDRGGSSFVNGAHLFVDNAFTAI